VARRTIQRNLRRRIRTACKSVVPNCGIGTGRAKRTCEAAALALRPGPIADATTATSAAADPVPQQTDGDGEDCRRSCVNHTLRDCFGQCAEACEGNQPALDFCRTACRNRHCELIVLVCGCDADSDCESNPVTTTTSSTSTITTTSTTTTIF
jgi:hypothetical protein